MKAGLYAGRLKERKRGGSETPGELSPSLVDTYTKVGFAKLYDRKTPLTAADLLNDRVVPFFETHKVV